MHYWSSPKLTRMAQFQRDIDRLLTRLETGPLPVQMVLGAAVARAIPRNFTVERRNHCQAGVYWYHIDRRKMNAIPQEG